jgi:hypothetical protein
MQWYEVAVGLIVALGGLGAFAQAVKALADWRAGVQQRAGVPTQKLVAYLEGEVAVLKARVNELEQARDFDTSYISLLVYTMASNGVPVPMRPAYGEKPPTT